MLTRDDFPEDVRRSFDEMASLFKEPEQRNDDHFMRSVTWNNWARHQTNHELAAFTVHVLKFLSPLPHNAVYSSLSEIMKRLKNRPKYRRLFPSERGAFRKGK